MLPSISLGNSGPVLVFIHLLGGSKREWIPCMQLLSDRFACIAIDLPGFGDACDIAGFTVEEMAVAVENTLKSTDQTRLILVGHSMGGKVAMVVAARKNIETAGLILVAPSPPSPEPITDKARAKLLAMGREQRCAETYLDGITAKPLIGKSRESGIADFIKCSPAAWSAWLENGSREDWGNRVGLLAQPALVITGECDPSLAAIVQESTTMKSLGNGRIEVIPDCGHLLPGENVARMESLIAQFVIDSF